MNNPQKTHLTNISTHLNRQMINLLKISYPSSTVDKLDRDGECTAEQNNSQNLFTVANRRNQIIIGEIERPLIERIEPATFSKPSYRCPEPTKLFRALLSSLLLFTNTVKN